MTWLWIGLGVWAWFLCGGTLALFAAGWGREKTTTLGIYAVVVLWPIIVAVLPAVFIGMAVTLNAGRIQATEAKEKEARNEVPA